MTLRIALALVLPCAILIGCANNPPQAEKEPTEPDVTEPVTTDDAPAMEPIVVNIEPKSGSNLTGTATFTQENGEIKMVLNLEGAPPGDHAVHIHETGDCSAADASSAGAHWNPTDEAHGHLGETEAAHLGDIGNFDVSDDGTASFTYSTDKWAIGEGTNNMLGKALVVHEKADDFTSQPSGDAGGRIGCGVIEAESPEPRPSP